jgi:DNA replication and repair protein RecF
MHLQNLQLEEFRAYKHLEFSIPRSGCRLVGRNASGKSTLLEAVVVLATTRSPRTQADRELINWASGEAYGVPPYARASADVQDENDVHTVEVGLQVDPRLSIGTRKSFTLDGRSVRAHDVVGVIKVVLFTPEDLTLVVGPPVERRRHVDLLLSQLDRQYLRALSRYNRVLPQRNGLLKTLARDRVDARSVAAASQLAFWDERLVAEGAYLVAQRWASIGRLSNALAICATSLMEGATLGLHYEPRVELGSLDDVGSSIDDVAALTSWIAPRFERQLRNVREEDLRRGATTIGPHRDDVSFLIDGRSLAQYGSRGQQRLAVVSLKLAEATLITEQVGTHPVLLLDDVLSELDKSHRTRLISEVTDPGYQILLSSTEREPLDDSALRHLPLAIVAPGIVEFE